MVSRCEWLVTKAADIVRREYSYRPWRPWHSAAVGHMRRVTTTLRDASERRSSGGGIEKGTPPSGDRPKLKRPPTRSRAYAPPSSVPRRQHRDAKSKANHTYMRDWIGRSRIVGAVREPDLPPWHDPARAE